jgi:hypothetical protein
LAIPFAKHDIWSWRLKKLKIEGVEDWRSQSYMKSKIEEVKD